jgi:hypothetical protein
MSGTPDITPIPPHASASFIRQGRPRPGQRQRLGEPPQGIIAVRLVPSPTQALMVSDQGSQVKEAKRRPLDIPNFNLTPTADVSVPRRHTQQPAQSQRNLQPTSKAAEIPRRATQCSKAYIHQLALDRVRSKPCALRAVVVRRRSGAHVAHPLFRPEA